MDKPTIVIGTVGIIVTAWAGFYSYTQVKLIRQGNVRREKEERELAEWSARAQYVVLKLVGLVPRSWHGGNGLPNGQIYPMIVADSELRGLVQTYLIYLTSGGIRAEARMLPPEMLQLKVVRDTVKRVEDCFDAARRDIPLIANLADLN